MMSVNGFFAVVNTHTHMNTRDDLKKTTTKKHSRTDHHTS